MFNDKIEIHMIVVYITCMVATHLILTTIIIKFVKSLIVGGVA